LTHFSLFWPESLLTYILTGIGIVYFIKNWQRGIRKPLSMTRSTTKAIILPLILVYFIVPLLLIDGPEEADNHYLKTIRLPENRPGKYVEFDRVRYSNKPNGDFLQSSTSEGLRVQGLKLCGPATVSVRGVFINENEILVSEYHVHFNWFRDTASYLGLALIIFIWIWTFVKHRYT
jgi:hypothetical protein